MLTCQHLSPPNEWHLLKPFFRDQPYSWKNYTQMQRYLNIDHVRPLFENPEKVTKKMGYNILIHDRKRYLDNRDDWAILILKRLSRKGQRAILSFMDEYIIENMSETLRINIISEKSYNDSFLRDLRFSLAIDSETQKEQYKLLMMEHNKSLELYKQTKSKEILKGVK